MDLLASLSALEANLVAFALGIAPVLLQTSIQHFSDIEEALTAPVESLCLRST